MSSDDTTDEGSEVQLSVSMLGNDGAMSKARETTQLDERRIATDVGRGIKPPYNPETLAAFQELSETHQACIRKKARYEVGYGFDIIPHSSADEPERDGDAHQAVEDFWRGSDSRWQIGPEGTAASTPEEVLELARQDYHGIGWAALEILTEGDGTPAGLAHVPAATVRVRKTETDDDDQVLSGHGYVQVRQGRRRYFGEAGDRYGDNPKYVDKETGDVADDPGALTNGPANELIFVPNPSPLSLYYGIPDWVAAMQTMAADQSAKEWNHDIFENLGIPYYVIKVTGGTLTEESKDELRDLMDNLKGSRYRTALLEVEQFQEQTTLQSEDGNNIEIDLEPVGSREDADMEFEKFRTRNEHEIAKVHEVPPLLINVTESSNRANSKEQVREFAEDVIAPEQSKFEARLYHIIHQQALEVDDWTIDFVLRGANRPREEAQMAAQRVSAMQSSGVGTVNEAREELGLDPLDDDETGDMLLADLGGQPGFGGSDDGGDSGNPNGSDYTESLPASAHEPPAGNKIGERDWADVEAALVEKDPIESKTFDSSNLDQGLFDFEDNELYLSFERDGGQSSLYAYVNVPTTEWDALVNAGSHGSYHYNNIRLDYAYIEVTNFHTRLPEGPMPAGDDMPEDVPNL